MGAAASVDTTAELEVFSKLKTEYEVRLFFN